jgi:hypothetical protein
MEDEKLPRKALPESNAPAIQTITAATAPAAGSATGTGGSGGNP